MAKATRTASIVRLFAAASTAALALSATTSAFAQEAQADEQSQTIQEIVVTAQFREQKLQDTPLAITAVTAELIEARSATNLADVARAAPSVVLRPAAASFGNSISATIRGLGQGDFNPALEPGVGLYIDDVYYPRLTGANFDLLDVERVEVLRGPQGTLTGRNSEGGAIRFVSRKPTGEGGNISATYGSRNRMNLRATADFKLTDNLFARISGTFADQGGYVDVVDYGCAVPASGVPSTVGGTKCNLYKQGDVGYRALKGMLRYAPNDDLDIMITADYMNDARNNAPEVLLFGTGGNPNTRTSNGVPLSNNFICGPRCNYTTTGSTAGSWQAGVAIPALQGLPLPAVAGQQQTLYEGWGVSANIDYKLNDSLQIQSITAYRAWDMSFSVDGDLSPANTQFGNNALSHWFWSQELRLNANLADNLDLTVGGYYSDELTTYYTLQDIRYVAIPGLPPALAPLFPLQFIGNDPVDTEAKGAFGTLIYKPTEAMTITAGVRYSEDAKDYTFFRYNLDGRTINGFLDSIGAVYGAGFSGPDVRDANGNGNVTEIVSSLTGRTASFRGSRWDYRLSVDYRFSPEVMVYATTSTGYKAGGVGPRPFNAAQARGFGPEEVTSYELGIKTDLLDRRLRVNVTGFYNELKNAQLTLLNCPQFGGPGPCALPQNAGDATVKGVEFEAFFNPVEGLQFDASASYLKYTFDCVNPAVVGLPGGACSSDAAVVSRLADPAQGWQWNFGAQYEADLGSAGSITPRIDVNRQNKLPGNVLRAAAGSPSELFGQVPGYTITNGRLTWRNAERDLDISLEVTNVFNKYYFLNKFDLSDLAGSILGQVGRPREWALTVRKKF